jgi:hypothetical protein
MCECLWTKLGCTIIQACTLGILRSFCWKKMKSCLFPNQEKEIDIRKETNKTDLDPSLQIMLLKI